jgi:short-subunit dehydrogenase
LARSLAAITGASSGIGSVFARRLAPQYDLLLIARRRERLDELARELSARHGTAVTVLAADLTDRAQLQLVADRLSSEPNLGMFVNNAGFGNRGLFWETDLDAIDKMHRLHITASLKLIHAALRVMVKQNRGALINVASVASFAQRAGNASYGASKSWLATFSEGLYLDLKKANSAVTIQALCPGYTYSGFHDLLGEDRNRLASPSLWLTPEAVVDCSLAALPSRKLFVVPGWRYKLLIAVVSKLPWWLKIRLEASQGHRKP